MENIRDQIIGYLRNNWSATSEDLMMHLGSIAWYNRGEKYLKDMLDNGVVVKGCSGTLYLVNNK